MTSDQQTEDEGAEYRQTSRVREIKNTAGRDQRDRKGFGCSIIQR